MLFYFVFHFLKNCNDVYVMYCLPVGCNNKKYKLQKIALALAFDGLGSDMTTIIKKRKTTPASAAVTHLIMASLGRQFMRATIRQSNNFFLLENSQLNIVKA